MDNQESKRQFYLRSKAKEKRRDECSTLKRGDEVHGLDTGQV